MEAYPLEAKTDLEFVLVNDNSPDGDWKVVKELALHDARIIGINLSRNFGQHPAIIAGLSHAKGDWVAVMDGDLQDRPEEIPRLLEKALEGFDAVFACRKIRKDGLVKKLSSVLFNKTLHFLTGIKHDPAIANFGVYSRKVIESVLLIGDHIKMFPIFVDWVGFTTAKMDVMHDERFEGVSSYTFRKALSLAFNSLITFSDKPLKMTIKAGVFLSLLAILFAVYYFSGALLGFYSVAGWPSLIISFWFLGGMQIFFIGVLGVYIGKTFNQTKNRPVYIIREILNGK